MNLNLNFSIEYSWLNKLKRLLFAFWGVELWVVIIALAAAVLGTYYSFTHDIIVSYGDAESHLNIAKRVVDSLTPGFAQLGGIWLPLPHLLLLPFVKFDYLWRTGLAGSIVSGTAFVIAAAYLYRLTLVLTNNKLASFFAALVFICNPNILYLQSTPMTELTLIVFFVMSSYYFILHLKDADNLAAVLLAALFGFCAALSRYDGWFLVMAEAGILILYYLPWVRMPRNFRETKEFFDRKTFQKLEGILVIFMTLAFLGIAAWLVWDFVILGDPLYFTHSQFSAKSQQQGWLAVGQLPAYHNLWLSFLYYLVTSMSNIGIIIFIMGLIGLFYFLFDRPSRVKSLIALLLTSVFVFYVVTLYIGQSIIFIPSLTPTSFDWDLFNVRYGVMMVPLAAVMLGVLFNATPKLGAKTLVVALFIVQMALFVSGYSQPVSMLDGVVGLSQAKRPDAERFLQENYDGGLVLLDDFSRLTSIIRSGIPMEKVIYVGNRPYWEESLVEPEKYARWIVIQKNDEIWNHVLVPTEMNGRLYKYFEKVYTSPEILVFRRHDNIPRN